MTVSTFTKYDLDYTSICLSVNLVLKLYCLTNQAFHNSHS